MPRQIMIYKIEKYLNLSHENAIALYNSYYEQNELSELESVIEEAESEALYSKERNDIYE